MINGLSKLRNRHRSGGIISTILFSFFFLSYFWCSPDDVSRLSSQDIANTAWAFAILGMRHERFLDAVASQFVSRIDRYLKGDRSGSNFNGQELANSVW